MAVIPGSVEKKHPGSRGNFRQDGSFSYQARWRCTVDDPLDQAQVVANYFNDNVMALGDEYLYENDNIGSQAIATAIDAELAPNSIVDWNVTYTFESLAGQNQGDMVDETDTAVNDPENATPDFTMGTQSQSVPMLLGTYKYGINQTGYTVGKRMRPQNSAKVPFEPAPNMDTSRWIIPFAMNTKTFAADTASFANHVNTDTFHVSINGFTKTFLPYQARLSDLRLAYRRWKNINYWRLTFTLEEYIKTPDLGIAWGGTNWQQTWAEVIEDRGNKFFAKDGDKDDKGRTIGTDIPRKEGVAFHRKTDMGGKIINDLALDGSGKVLDLATVTGPEDFNYVVFLGYEETAFLAIPYLNQWIKAGVAP